MPILLRVLWYRRLMLPHWRWASHGGKEWGMLPTWVRNYYMIFVQFFHVVQNATLHKYFHLEICDMNDGWGNECLTLGVELPVWALAHIWYLALRILYLSFGIKLIKYFLGSIINDGCVWLQVCPVCAMRVGVDMVAHITLQHGNIYKISFFCCSCIFAKSFWTLSWFFLECLALHRQITCWRDSMFPLLFEWFRT